MGRPFRGKLYTFFSQKRWTWLALACGRQDSGDVLLKKKLDNLVVGGGLMVSSAWKVWHFEMALRLLALQGSDLWHRVH